jgi:hypothetical protein
MVVGTVRNCWLGVPRDQHQQTGRSAVNQVADELLWCSTAMSRLCFLFAGFAVLPAQVFTLGRWYKHRILQQYNLIGLAALKACRRGMGGQNYCHITTSCHHAKCSYWHHRIFNTMA